MNLLLKAVENGELKRVKKLIEKGADANECGKDSFTPLMKACFYGEPGKGHYEIAKYLKEKGADINFRNKAGWTALFCAVTRGNLKIVQLLVKNGANVNETIDAKGKTMLMRAAHEGYLEIVKFLIKSGADFRQKNNGGLGWTALDYAKCCLDHSVVPEQDRYSLKAEAEKRKIGKLLEKLLKK
ncbi:ankyrin repeat domain-containing protein [Candidatus Micrarchaeota archaeon]|nr:ankyrin repeat domain-containing protein [Candidatus Micrarchaeota archaeon]